MGSIETRLKTMGFELPPPFVFPKNNRTGCTQVGALPLQGEEATMIIRPIMRSPGPLLHLFPGDRLGEAGSRPN